MARTPRTFSCRGHTEAKAGEDIGQSKPREDVTEKAKETNQQETISEVSLTRSPSRFLGTLSLLPRLRSTSFHGFRLRDGRTWRERVLSFKYRRRKETKKYHRAQQSPHENDWFPRHQNIHGRPPGTKSGSRLPLLYCENPRQVFREHRAHVIVGDIARLEILSTVAPVLI